MSDLIDRLNPPREFEVSAGVIVKYRHLSLKALTMAMQSGLKEQNPQISASELSKRVTECMTTGKDVPDESIKYVLVAGLEKDNEITAEEADSLFTVDLSEKMTELALAIMGVTERENDQESSADPQKKTTDKK